MALIKCIDCGRDFSSHAKACPFCGCPTGVVLEQSAANGMRDDVAQQPPTPPAATAAAAAPIVAPIGVASTGAVAASATPIDAIPTSASAAEGTRQDDYRALVCPACGSNDIDMVSTDYGICTHCKTKIVLKENNQPQNIIHVHANVNRDGAYYGVRQTLQATDFYRKALLDMVKSESTPPDLFDAAFEEADLAGKHMATFQANITGSYSAEIGTNMVRETQQWNGHKYVTKRENYIQWEPFAGNYAGTQRAFRSLDHDDPLDEGIEAAYCYLQLDEGFEGLLEGTDDVVIPTQQDMQSALEECKRSAARECEQGLPGDHRRNFHFSGNGQISQYTCHTIPAYSMHFRYHEEEYAKCGFAVENTHHTMYGHIPNVSDEIKADVDKTTRPLGIASVVLLSAALVATMLFLVIHESVLHIVSLSVSGGILAAAVGVTIGYWIWRSVYKKAIITANKMAKLKGVERVMQEKHLTPLTEEEIDAVMGRKRK